MWRFAKPLRVLMAFAAVVLARIEILIATLMFHSAARPFASIIDVHSIWRNFKGFSCLRSGKSERERGVGKGRERNGGGRACEGGRKISIVG